MNAEQGFYLLNQIQERPMSEREDGRKRMATTLDGAMRSNERRGLAPMVASELRGMIFRNQFQPGDQLPSEMQLASKFQVSRDTIRSAITELCSELLLEKRRGLGTYVLDRAARPSHGLEKLIGMRQGIESAGMNSEVIALRVEHVTKAATVSDAFRVTRVGDLVRIQRTWAANANPAVYAIDWIPESVLPDPSSLDDLSTEDSLSGRLAQYGHSIDAAVTSFRAVLSLSASEQLQTPPGKPLLLLDQIHYTGQTAGTPVLYSNLYWDGDTLPLHLVRRAVT